MTPACRDDPARRPTAAAGVAALLRAAAVAASDDFSPHLALADRLDRLGGPAAAWAEYVRLDVEQEAILFDVLARVCGERGAPVPDPLVVRHAALVRQTEALWPVVAPVMGCDPAAPAAPHRTYVVTGPCPAGTADPAGPGCGPPCPHCRGTRRAVVARLPCRIRAGIVHELQVGAAAVLPDRRCGRCGGGGELVADLRTAPPKCPQCRGLGYVPGLARLLPPVARVVPLDRMPDGQWWWRRDTPAHMYAANRAYLPIPIWTRLAAVARVPVDRHGVWYPTRTDALADLAAACAAYVRDYESP